LDGPTTTSDGHRLGAAGSSDRAMSSAAPPAEQRTGEPTVRSQREPMLQGLMDEPQGDLPRATVEPRLERRERHEQLVPQSQQPLQEPTAGSRRELGGCW
jgi:hypothetical protein